MTWSEFYLVCFLVGFGLSLISFLAGSFHMPHLHVPHLHFDFHHGLHMGHGHGAGGGETPWFNFATISVFLTWFGGTGYLLQRYSTIWALLALAIAVLAGIGGAAVVFWFLAKYLVGHQKVMDPADFDMIGVLGKLSVPIRSGGTGELIFTQDGTRRVTGARAEGGAAIDKGTEVVVTRYEKGIAYVRPWDELTNAL
ncbi:MAG TPA: NfeD family protein [Candidatus Acidoferrales bacterium]|nr:NfeD family protein [Candidatus Acidoferrales bacterium]